MFDSPSVIEGSFAKPVRYAIARMGNCNACKRRMSIINSGLCSTCYRSEEKRERYGTPKNVAPGRLRANQPRVGCPVGDGGSSGENGDGQRIKDLAGVYQRMEATPFRPGTWEKLSVMEERAMMGLPLFHPLDADFSGNGTPLGSTATGTISIVPIG